MDTPGMVLAITFGLLVILMSIGIKIAVALAIAGVVGFFVFQGHPGLTPLVPFRTLDSFILTAVPLFIYMGEILVHCGASDMIYRGVSRLLSWAPGGLLHTNIGACALFAAISGSSPATAATIGSVAIPQLKKRKYDTNLVLGSLAAGGTLGILIPPSINMIVYGAISKASVGQLFAGGVIPGIILAVMFMIYIAIRTKINPRLASREEAHLSIKVIGLSFLDLWPLLVLGVVVLGGIFGGVMTPTEAAAIGASGAMLIAVVLRRFNLQFLKRTLLSTLETTSMVFFIVVGASILASVWARAGIPAFVTGYVDGLDVSKWVLILSIYGLYIFLGCFIDPVSIIILTASTVLPIIRGLGLDIVWFGVMYVVTAEAGMITPPMGLNLFVIQGISKEDIGKVVIGSFPFFLIILLVLALLTAFPSIVLWLPSVTMG